MTRSIKISLFMHKLLIEKGMDGFSVIELRDAFLSLNEFEVNSEEARKTVYRQILRFLRNNWLRSKGKGRQKRYFKTDLFHSLHVIPKLERSYFNMTSEPDYSVLRYECDQYRAELEIVLGEIDEYKSLNCRFPELELKLNPLLEHAKERSAHLLGKVNVLTNVLKTLSVDVAA